MVRRGKGESVDGNGKKREGEGGMGRRGKGEWEEEGREKGGGKKREGGRWSHHIYGTWWRDDGRR